MAVYQNIITISTHRQGLTEISAAVEESLAKSNLQNGLISAFCRHTSCSLILMENADPTARGDLEKWINKLVPPGQTFFEHTLEGPDDMPSHIKMALTRTSEQIPFNNAKLLWGTWQGLYLWEHRSAPHRREIVITAIGE